MAARICWHCKVSAHHERVSDVLPSAIPNSWMAAFRCNECRVLSIGVLDAGRDDDVDRQLAAAIMESYEARLLWLPLSAPGREYPDVPEHIAAAASEAHRCHNIGAFRGAVLMARSVIEATAKAKNITTGTLASKIDKMHDDRLIRELVKDQAHEIRYLGNEMAHGDFVAPISEEEAAEILELMAEVLDEVFQAPARLQARRQARLDRATRDSDR